MESQSVPTAVKPTPQIPTKKPRKQASNKETAIGLLVILVVIVGIVMAVSGGSKTKAKTVASTTSTPAQTTSTKPAATTSTPAAATRQVTGTATTLGAGSFTGGSDVPVGLYNVTTTAGQSGNFMVSGTDSYNEILGVSDGQGVPAIRVQISKGDQISISGLSSVTFTPVTTPFVTTHSTVTLSTGTFVVGQDIGAGKYVATPASGQSGNFIVTGNDSYNEILGGGSADGGVPSVSVSLSDGDVIQISGMSSATMTASN